MFWSTPEHDLHQPVLRFIYNDDVTCVCVCAFWQRKHGVERKLVQKGWPPKIAKATPISWCWQIVTNFPISVLFVSGLLASGQTFSGHVFIWNDLVEKVWTTESNYKLLMTLLSVITYRHINTMTQTQSSVSWNQKIKMMIYETQVLINKKQKATSSQQTAPAWLGKQPLIWCCVLVANMVGSYMTYHYEFWLCLLSC